MLFEYIMSNTDIFINDSGGYRLNLKSSNLFSSSFSTDFMIKYYNGTSQDTFVSSSSRIILSAMAAASTTNTRGIILTLERNANNIDFVSVLVNYDNKLGWDYMPGLSRTATNGDSIPGIQVTPDGYYYISFNYVKVNSNGYASWQLNVIKGPTSTPETAIQTISYVGTSSSVIDNLNYGPQLGFGSPNESIAADQTTFSNITTNGFTTYSARNISINFLRAWDGNVNTSSTNWNPVSLYNLNISQNILNISDKIPAGYMVSNDYPVNFGTEPTTTNSPDYQRLAFQLSTKNVTAGDNGVIGLEDLRNTAFIAETNSDNYKKTNGVVPHLQTSPTSYPPLEDWALNSSIASGSTLIEINTDSNSIGDPHIYPIIKPNYHIYEEGKFLYFSYEKEDDYVKLYCDVRKIYDTPNGYYNDILTLDEKKGNEHYISIFDFNTFKVDNLRENMKYITKTTIKNNGVTTNANTHSFYITCLNKHVSFCFDAHGRNVLVRLDMSILPFCSGGLISQKKLIKIS